MINSLIDRMTTAYLECPCCGNDGAMSDTNGLFIDGQSLICGCTGHVNVEEDGDVWINNFDCPCQESIDDSCN